MQDEGVIGGKGFLAMQACVSIVLGGSRVTWVGYCKVSCCSLQGGIGNLAVSTLENWVVG